MWFELGHHVVWYVHGYEHFGGAFGLSTQAIKMMEAVGPGQIVCADHLVYTIP